MSPLWSKWHVNFIKLSDKKPSLTLQINRKRISLARGLKAIFDIEGIPLFTSFSGGEKQVMGVRKSDCLDASMTVEAAMVIPLLMFFFLNLMSSVEMIRLHGNLAAALWENGRIMAVSGYAYNVDGAESVLEQLGGKLLSDLAIETMIVHDLGEEYLDSSPLTYGRESLSFLESAYMEHDCIDIKLTYRVSPFFTVPGFRSFRMANRYYIRAWTGYEVWKENDHSQAGDYVYVTPHGEVYHERADCSYLVRRIEQISMAEVGSRCNSSGELYLQCRQCEKKISTTEEIQSVYVTSEGERYHFTLECTALKRIVRMIACADAQKQYRPCSRCAE